MAEVSALNLAEDPVTVTFAFVDEDTDEAEVINEVVLASFESTAQMVPELTYDISFVLDGGADLGTCRIAIRPGDVVQFMVVELGVAIVRDGDTSTDHDDLFVATSSLCGN